MAPLPPSSLKVCSSHFDYQVLNDYLAPLRRDKENPDGLLSHFPALHNPRLRTDAVKGAKARTYPFGTGWPGLFDICIKEKDLPADERYIWAAQLTNNVHIAVTMFSGLAEWIHKVNEIVCDFTFKRVVGPVNEWEVAVFLPGWNESMYCFWLPHSIADGASGCTVARIYSDATSQHDYAILLELFHQTIAASTGRPLQLRMIHGSGPIAYVLDADAAQALGLAKAIRRLPGFQESCFTNDHDILAHTLLTCHVHFKRSEVFQS